jgi:hypothetical protein
LARKWIADGSVVSAQVWRTRVGCRGVRGTGITRVGIDRVGIVRLPRELINPAASLRSADIIYRERLFELNAKGSSGRHYRLLSLYKQHTRKAYPGAKSAADRRALASTGYPSKDRTQGTAAANKHYFAAFSISRNAALFVYLPPGSRVIRRQYSDQPHPSPARKHQILELNGYRAGSAHPFRRRYLGYSPLDYRPGRDDSRPIDINRNRYRHREPVPNVGCPGG